MKLRYIIAPIAAAGTLYILYKRLSYNFELPIFKGCDVKENLGFGNLEKELKLDDIDWGMVSG